MRDASGVFAGLGDVTTATGDGWELREVPAVRSDEGGTAATPGYNSDRPGGGGV